mgnify:CR=1 FL=1
MKIYFHMCIDGFSNCYLIVNEATKQAIIIDPGEVSMNLIEQIEGDGYGLEAVLITHNHPSSTQGMHTLLKIYSPEIYGANIEYNSTKTTILRGDGTIRIAGLDVEHLAMPGHSSDSMVYKIGQVLFTGECLTAGLVGDANTQYSKRILINNIRQKVLSQADSTAIFPSKGPPSTVGAERKFNTEILRGGV